MGKAYTPNIKSDKGKNLTKYVAEFVRKNKYNKIRTTQESVGRPTKGRAWWQRQALIPSSPRVPYLLPLK